MKKLTTHLYIHIFLLSGLLAAALPQPEEAQPPFLEDSTWLAPLKVRAKVTLDNWESRDPLTPLITFYTPLDYYQPLSERLNLPRGIKLKPDDIPFEEIRSGTAYQVDLAQSYLIPKHLQSPQIMVSPITLASLAYQATKKLLPGLFNRKHDYSNLYVRKLDIDLLDIVWENPDLTAYDIYALYLKTPANQHLSFMDIQYQLDQLESDKLLTSRKPHKLKIYSAIKNRTWLSYHVQDKLDLSDALHNGARHFELLRIRQVLEGN